MDIYCIYMGQNTDLGLHFEQGWETNRRGQPGAVEQDLLIEWETYRKWATGRVESMGQDIKEVWKLGIHFHHSSQVWETKVMVIAAVPPVSTEEHRRCQGCISDVMDLPWPWPRPVVLQASTTSILTLPPPPNLLMSSCAGVWEMPPPQSQHVWCCSHKFTQACLLPSLLHLIIVCV